LFVNVLILVKLRGRSSEFLWASCTYVEWADLSNWKHGEQIRLQVHNFFEFLKYLGAFLDLQSVMEIGAAGSWWLFWFPHMESLYTSLRLTYTIIYDALHWLLSCRTWVEKVDFCRLVNFPWSWVLFICKYLKVWFNSFRAAFKLFFFSFHSWNIST